MDAAKAGEWWQTVCDAQGRAHWAQEDQDTQ